jgi:ferredoxin
MLVIDPDVCIDCAVCIPECPVNAIVSQDDLRPDQQEWLELNAQLSQQWPVISQSEPAPADAGHWAQIPQKKHLLHRG